MLLTPEAKHLLASKSRWGTAKELSCTLESLLAPGLSCSTVQSLECPGFLLALGSYLETGLEFSFMVIQAKALAHGSSFGVSSSFMEA